MKTVHVILILACVRVALCGFPDLSDSPMSEAADGMIEKGVQATNVMGAVACATPNISIPEEILNAFAGAEKKMCEPVWNSDGSGVDAMCLEYPKFCDKMPKIPSQVFAAFTEGFPCWSLNACHLEKFNEAKRDSPSTIIKCWFDIAICFFNACWPGMHPSEMKKMIMSGQFVESAPAMAEGIGRLGQGFIKDQAEGVKEAAGGGDDLPNPFG